VRGVFFARGGERAVNTFQTRSQLVAQAGLAAVALGWVLVLGQHFRMCVASWLVFATRFAYSDPSAVQVERQEVRVFFFSKKYSYKKKIIVARTLRST